MKIATFNVNGRCSTAGVAPLAWRIQSRYIGALVKDDL
jgi:hypothetical protein